MFEKLQGYLGKKIAIELVNGRMVSGTVLGADQQCIRMETDDGVGTIPVKAIQIIWESMDRSVSGEHKEQSAGQMRDDVKAQISCVSFPGFTCAQSYICRPPDNCAFSFACPGSYVPNFPSGGGGCPLFFCGSFQFQQPCGPFTFQPCPFTFGLPCGPFTFQQPCGPFTFGLPCGPFQFGGSQCGTFGGFTCAGQQFIGLAGSPGGSQCGVPGGFACSGAQFAGMPVKPPGAVTKEGITLPPMNY